ncbi:WD40 repeat domain-containing protein [Myxococcus qinghaiensis]|uniref:WD40 repeat domain-containing protein n=1 Tax=Myxococcus qinghaiensis TaxID=2906758 RepID=UPI0020A78682|nr:WD40 repeat domain-containing protein [Myxococcus qinghaiensis]MCP3166720.1 WD40 repeat domain-containing protein [Myxococcus qinghaiensis]
MTYDLQSLTELSTLEDLVSTQGVTALLATLDEVLSRTPPDALVLKEVGPAVGPRTLRVLRKAVELDATFLQAHPEALFQCLYNRLRWHDAPDAAAHFETEGPGPWSAPDAHLFKLAEHWRRQRDVDGAAPWVESLLPLRGALESADSFYWHDAQVLCAAYNPAGTRLATGSWSDGNNVRVWDVATGECVQVMEGHEGEVRGIAWSADGTQLASGSRGHDARIWDVATGALLKDFPGQEGQVTSVAFSPDGRLLASGNLGWLVHVFEVDSGRLVKTLKGHEQSVLALSFHPSGRWLASGASDSTLRIWDTATWTQVTRIDSDGYVDTVEFSPDGEWISWAVFEGIAVADTRTWTRLPGTRGAGRYSQVGWLGTHRLGLLAYNRVEVLEVRDGTVLWSRPYPSDGHQRGAAFSPDGKRFALTAADGGLLVSDLYAPAPPTLRVEPKRVHELWGEPEGAAAFAQRYDGGCAIDAQGGVREYRLDPDAVPMEPWSISSDGALAAYPIQLFMETPSTRGVRLLDLKSLTPVKTLFAKPLNPEDTKKRYTQPQPVALSPDGQLVAAALEAGCVRVWRVVDGALLHTLRGAKGLVSLVAFTPDGEHVVCGYTDDARLWVYEVKGGRNVLTTRALLEPQPSYATATQPSRLAVGRASGELEVYDLTTGSSLRLIQVCNEEVIAVALSEDGSLVAACGSDRRVRLFDVATGALRYELPHASLAFAVSVGQHFLVTQANDMRTRQFDLSSGTLRTELPGGSEPDDVTRRRFWEVLGEDPVCFHRQEDPTPLAHFHDPLEATLILRDGLVVGRGRAIKDFLYVLRIHADRRGA